MDKKNVDYYKLLGVSRYESTDKIEEAANNLLKKYEEEEKEQILTFEDSIKVEQRKALINEAKNVLCDIESRNKFNQLYDQFHQLTVINTPKRNDYSKISRPDIVRKSTTGTPTKNTRKKKKITKSKKARLKASLVACVIAVGLGVPAVIKTIDKINEFQERIVINEVMRDFRSDYINGHDITGRLPATKDNSNNWYYKTEVLADIVKDHEELLKDDSLTTYMIYNTMGNASTLTDYMNQFTRYIGSYDGFEDFLTQHGFSSVEEWKEVERNKILAIEEMNDLESENNKHNSELESMQEEYENKFNTSLDNYVRNRGGK